jgi:hypothetical protein
MPFGRVKPADVDATLRMASSARADKAANPPSAESSDPTPPDQQHTMPLGNDDDTLPLDRG